MNLCGTALFEEMAKFGVQYYVCVSTQATETKTKFGAHWFFECVNAGQKTVGSSKEQRFIRHRGVIGLTLSTLPSHVSSIIVSLDQFGTYRATQLTGHV